MDKVIVNPKLFIDLEVGRDSRKRRVIDRGELGLENMIVLVLVIFKEMEL